MYSLRIYKSNIPKDNKTILRYSTVIYIKSASFRLYLLDLILDENNFLIDTKFNFTFYPRSVNYFLSNKFKRLSKRNSISRAFLKLFKYKKIMPNALGFLNSHYTAATTNYLSMLICVQSIENKKYFEIIENKTKLNKELYSPLHSLFLNCIKYSILNNGLKLNSDKFIVTIKYFYDKTHLKINEEFTIPQHIMELA